MARAAWAVVAVGALVISYVACENTWRGLRQDTQENTALAKQKAREAKLDEKAKVVGEEAREAARQAGDNLKKLAGNLRSKDEPAPVVPGPTTASGTSSAARDVNDTIGKVAAKTKEVGENIADGLKGAKVHLEVEKALAGDSGLDSSHIDVDVSDETRTIVLRGSVPNAAQKTAARRIAAEHAHGYAIRDELATIAAAR